MARLDWDRLRRIHPLDGADARVDPDGTVLWERDGTPAREDELRASPGLRRLRAGIVVRRRALERHEEAEHGAAFIPEPTPSRPLPPRIPIPFDATAWVECPRCRARVPKKKLLLHARAACTRRG